jgi:hypothetical protein
MCILLHSFLGREIANCYFLNSTACGKWLKLINKYYLFPANESRRRTGLDLSLLAKFSFYLPAFAISYSCRTASVEYRIVTFWMWAVLAACLFFDHAASLTENIFLTVHSIVEVKIFKNALNYIQKNAQMYEILHWLAISSFSFEFFTSRFQGFIALFS